VGGVGPLEFAQAGRTHASSAFAVLAGGAAPVPGDGGGLQGQLACPGAREASGGGGAGGARVRLKPGSARPLQGPACQPWLVAGGAAQARALPVPGQDQVNRVR
jgi:hypothetical protein